MACPVVGQQVDLTLPLLLLQPEFSSSVTEGATAAKEDEDGPEQPEPCRGVERKSLRYLPCKEGSLKARIPRSKGGWAEGPENGPHRDSHQSS